MAPSRNDPTMLAIQSLQAKVASLEKQLSEKEAKEVRCSLCDKPYYQIGCLHKHIRDHGGIYHRLLAAQMDETHCFACGESMATTDKLEEHEKELHGMKYNSRVEMLFRLLPATMLGVEAARDGQNPPDVTNDDTSQPDTSIAPTNEAQILEVAQLGSAFSSANIEHQSSTSGFATTPAAERIGLNSTITDIQQHGSGALNSFSNGSNEFAAKAEGFSSFQDGISSASNAISGFSNQLRNFNVFPNGVAQLNKAIYGLPGQPQGFSDIQDGILSASNTISGFSNQLRNPNVFLNSVAQLNKAIYGLPGQPQGFSDIQDGISSASNTISGFSNQLRNPNVFPNSVAQLNKVIYGLPGQPQGFSGIQDGILGANNINGFSNPLRDPDVFPNGVERLNETTYRFPQGFSGIQDTNRFPSPLGSLNGVLNETEGGNLGSQMTSIEPYTSDSLWNVGGD